MLKRLMLNFIVLFISLESFAQTNPIITSWQIKDSSSISSEIKSVYFSQSLIYVEKNIQKFQKKSWYTFPINPDTAKHKKDNSKLLYSGMMINGVLIYKRFQSKQPALNSKNAIEFKKTSNDTALINGVAINLKPMQHSSIIGFANDGFPIYGPYGFYNKNGTGEIVRMKSGFQFKSKPKRKDSKKVITDFNAYEFKSSTFPDHLDEHNGRFCITPEYPQGSYCYFLTIDSLGNPFYPFLIGPTLFGSPLSKVVDTIDEPHIKYANSKKEIKLSNKEEKLPFTIFFAEKSELIVIQSNGMINEDIKLQLYEASGNLIKETTLFQGSTIAYFDAQTLYNGEYLIKIIRTSGTTEQKLMINKTL